MINKNFSDDLVPSIIKADGPELVKNFKGVNFRSKTQKGGVGTFQD